MNRVVPVLIIVMFFVAACASPGATATQAPSQPTATEVPAPTQSAPTEVPATSAVTEPPVISANGTQVDVTLADNTIDASTTTFKVGVPYTFVITNTGRHAHNFNINPPVSIAGSLEEALNKALLAVPQQKLAPGQSATASFTFPDSAAGQLLEFSCLIRSHYDDGMHVDITVEK